MTNDLPGRRFGALNAWPEPGQPGAWRYLPRAPAPQRGGGGRPQVGAIEAGEMLILTVGASLAASEADQEAARAEIATEAGTPREAVDLRQAEATVRGAVLMLTVDGAEPVELARANPSPLAPHPAAFSAMLQGERAKQANVALKAGTGRLTVRYDVELPMRRSVTARLSGASPGSGDVEAAIEAGALRLTIEADEGASDALRADARRRVVEDAARMAGRMAPQSGWCGGEESIEAEVTRTEPAPLALSLEADVAEWLAGR